MLDQLLQENEMKGKIFNAQEVQAILVGNKRMFREVIKPQPRDKMVERHGYFGTGLPDDGRWEKAPYQVGQKIFCKESFSMVRPAEWHSSQNVWYWAKGNPAFGDWEEPKPAQHMKQEHSRITLLIKEIRVERLGDISEEDAIAEGFEPDFDWPWPCGDKYITKTSKNKFIEFWNATHKKPEEKFEASPWVFVYTMEVVK